MMKIDDGVRSVARRRTCYAREDYDPLTHDEDVVVCRCMQSPDGEVVARISSSPLPDAS